MIKTMNCYKVKVRTTNSSNNNFRSMKDEYFPCENSIMYVVTDDPTKIYLEYGSDIIISVENIGFGYSL